MSRAERRVFDSVREMVQATGDAAFLVEYDRQIKMTRVVGLLQCLRASTGQTQAEFAERLGKTQSYISKLENSRDTSLRLGEIERYLAALGVELRLHARPLPTDADDPGFAVRRQRLIDKFNEETEAAGEATGEAEPAPRRRTARATAKLRKPVAE